MAHPSSLLFDGLRRCLCPGVGRASWLSVMRTSAAQPRLPSLERRPVRSARRTISRPVRTYSASTTNESTSRTQNSVPAPPHSTHFAVSESESSRQLVTPDELLRVAKQLSQSQQLLDSALEKIQTESIHATIVVLRQPDATDICDLPSSEVRALVIKLATFLVTNRGMQASPFIYESLMDTMAHPQGSAEGAFELLKDMDKAGLKLTETICRSTLRVLTVHPHYRLQVFILGVMREHWYSFSSKDAQNVVLGLLRDGQDEMAYERFMEMIHGGTEPDIWVYDVLAMTLGSKRFHEEMLEIFKLRGKRDNHGDSYVNLVYHVLDCSSKGFHHQGTTAAWDMGVKQGLFDPSDGILDNVLSTAATYGDPELASSAYEMLSSRTRVLADQYSALMQAFCEGEDIPGALRVLSIVEGLGIYPAAIDGMIRQLRNVLNERNDSAAFHEAFKAIKDLAAEGMQVSHGLKGLIRATARTFGGERAEELLRDMPVICGQEPDGETLRCMIKYTNDLDLRRTFAQQYRDTIPEDSQNQFHWKTYGRLIHSCVEIQELDLAIRFALELIHSDELHRDAAVTWWRPLLTCAWKAQDDKIWEVYDGLTKPRVLRARTREQVIHILREVEGEYPRQGEGGASSSEGKESLTAGKEELQEVGATASGSGDEELPK